MAKRNDIDKILESIRELRASDQRLGKRIDEVDERLGRRIAEVDERLGRRIDEFSREVQAKFETVAGTMGNLQGEALECAAVPSVMRELELGEGLEFKETLRSRFVPVDGAYREFDLYGTACRDGVPLLVLGEVKRAPTMGDLVGFDADTAAIVKRRKGKVIRVLFCVHITRRVRREAIRRGMRVFVRRARPPRGA